MVSKKSYETTKLQDKLAERLAATKWTPGGRTFAGRWWGRGQQAERFYFGESATWRKNGKRVRGIRVWLQFDDPATLDGVMLQVEAPKAWYRSTLAERHTKAALIAIELADHAKDALIATWLAPNC